MDDNDDELLEDNDDSDEDGSGLPSDEEEVEVDMPLSKVHAHITAYLMLNLRIPMLEESIIMFCL